MRWSCFPLVAVVALAPGSCSLGKGMSSPDDSKVSSFALMRGMPNEATEALPVPAAGELPLPQTAEPDVALASPSAVDANLAPMAPFAVDPANYDETLGNAAEIELGDSDPADVDPGGELDPERSLVATARYTHIYRRPKLDAPKIGYLRAGSVVRRDAEPVRVKGCDEGFYRIQPEGYVCVGNDASLDVRNIVATSLTVRPARTSALPYYYGISKHPPPPLYTRVPTPNEQRSVELELTYHQRFNNAGEWTPLGLGQVPEFLQDGQSSIRPNGTRQSELVLKAGQAIAKSGFALLNIFRAEDRSFGLTADLAVVPLDRLDLVKPSRFHGLPLSNGVTLPVVFVRAKNAYLYEGDPKRQGLSILRPLEYREAVPITGKKIVSHGLTYLETRQGQWLIDNRLVRIDHFDKAPAWAQPGRSWIDVSILKQTLVAYEGTVPVFATLVSTGVDGLGDPTETHSTLTGRFLIHTKHVTVTMSGDEVGDEFDLRDVPYVQYFQDGFALHAAYWHDAFGTPRSHGCVNLSPLDARWLFGFTDPPVPQKWHGAMSLLEGTLVNIHP